MFHRDHVPSYPRGHGRIVTGTLHPSTIRNWLDPVDGFGIGRIKDQNGDLAGMRYADDQRGYSVVGRPNNFKIVKMSHSYDRPGFEQSNSLPMNLNGIEENAENNKFDMPIPLPVRGKECWIMVVDDHRIYGKQGIYERVALGWITESALETFSKRRDWVVLG